MQLIKLKDFGKINLKTLRHGTLKPISYKCDKIVSLNDIFLRRKLPMPIFFQKRKQKNEFSSQINLGEKFLKKSFD